MHTSKVTQKGHRQICREFLQQIKYPFLDQEMDACIRKWFWRKRYKIDEESMTFGHEYYGVPKNDCTINVYTDGSVVRNPKDIFDTQAGGGIFISGGREALSNKLGPNTTIFQAECHSIKRSAQWLLRNQPEIAGRNVAIYSDSRAVIMALQKPYTKSKLVYTTMQLLSAAAAKCNNLYIRWVKAHKGIPGNERADELAVSASKSDGPLVHDLPLVSKEMAKRSILIGTDKLWEWLFLQLRYPEECRQTKNWFPHIDRARSYKILTCNRLQWGKLNQFMTGHNFLKRHNNVVDPNEAPTCDLCDFGYIQDTEHIVAECPYFLGLRCDLFNQHLLVPPFDDIPIGKLLTFLFLSNLPALAWDVNNVVRGK